jgi:hypothetical protein
VSEIKVGDLVAVIRYPCCGAYLGVIMQVTRLTHTFEDYQCEKCRHWHGLNHIDSAIDDNKVRGTGRHFPLAWLRKIPPLAELNEVERKEETPA